MSSEADRAIKAVLDEHGESWSPGTVWRVQGTAVISHKALERIAARASIQFDLPTIIRAERDEAVMLVVGYRGEAREWSVGECVINQNYKVSGKQAAYPWAMSEKRAKDRVILKLLSLHGLAYSEEEADDLQAGKPKESSGSQQDGIAGVNSDLGDAREEYVETCLKTIRGHKSGSGLREWWKSPEHRQAMEDFELGEDHVDRLKAALTDRLSEIGRAPEKSPPSRANGHDRREGARPQ